MNRAAQAGLAEEVVARALVALELQQLIEMVAPAQYRRVHRPVMRAIEGLAGQQLNVVKAATNETANKSRSES
jgi:hypothetical protein